MKIIEAAQAFLLKIQKKELSFQVCSYQHQFGAIARTKYQCIQILQSK